MSEIDQHTSVADLYRTGADWASLIEGYEEDQPPPDPASMSADVISRQLGVLRRLYKRQADYEALHVAELDRLEQRRAALTGPLVERIQTIEASLRQYALRSFLDWGKTGTILATPNGVIRSTNRDLVPKIDVDVELAKDSPLRSMQDVIEYKPQVRMAQLREWMTRLEQTDTLRRAIKRGDTLERIDKGATVRKPLKPGETGVWVDANDKVWEGVTWYPAGEQGCGRDFTIQAI